MSDRQLATLGGGCFWCLEAVYLDLRGVIGVISGYAGGHVANPSYEQVCSKSTGHVEVVQLSFNPAERMFDFGKVRKSKAPFIRACIPEESIYEILEIASMDPGDWLRYKS